MPPGAQVARVAVDDENWLAFRQVALTQGISISAYLARLVEAELKRRAGRVIATVTPEMAESDQAIAALAELRVAIDELELVAGRLARSAVAHGGSWDDIASSLRISRAQAERAYREA